MKNSTIDRLPTPVHRKTSIHTNLALGLKVAGSALFLGLFALAPTASAGEANLTRFGPKVYEREHGAPTSVSASFKAIDGPAELVLQDDGIDSAQIKINGLEVVGPRDFRGNGEIVVPVHLYPENTIEVSVRGKPGGKNCKSKNKNKHGNKHGGKNCQSGGELGVRVTQFTQSNFNVRAKMYFGVNTSNMDTQRAFYNTLGLVGEIFPAGPEQSKTFAQSLGFPDNYLIYVSLTSFTGAPPWIDTVQFREDRKSTRLNSSHDQISYAVFCLNKKIINTYKDF